MVARLSAGPFSRDQGIEPHVPPTNEAGPAKLAVADSCRPARRHEPLPCIDSELGDYRRRRCWKPIVRTELH